MAENVTIGGNSLRKTPLPVCRAPKCGPILGSGSSIDPLLPLVIRLREGFPVRARRYRFRHLALCADDRGCVQAAMFKKKSSKEKNAEDDVPPAPKSPQPTPSYGGQPDVGGETTDRQRGQRQRDHCEKTACARCNSLEQPVCCRGIVSPGLVYVGRGAGSRRSLFLKLHP